jgi:hypothetical protein
MASTTRRRGRSWKKILLWAIGGAVMVFILIQFVPYGRASHSNPPASNPFQWTDPQAEAIARRSCYDCHSNETKWWWATNIAPFSWLVQHDVDDARAHLNFSEWDGRPPAEAIQEAVNGKMPPIQYTLIHPGAKLSDAEKRTLTAGYRDSLAVNGGVASDGGQSTPTAAPTAAGNTADATAIIASRCSACHQAPTTYRAGSAAEAQALIDNMIQQGATVTPAEEQALIAYFTR